MGDQFLMDRLGKVISAAIETAQREDLSPQDFRDHLAEAALMAIRDPTEGMAQAGAQAIPAEDKEGHTEVAKDVWRLMVADALLTKDLHRPSKMTEEIFGRDIRAE